MNTRSLSARVRIHAGAVAAGVVGLSLSAGATAQDVPARGPVPFAVYDQNGDGAVSEAEFDAVRAKRQSEGRPMRRAPSFAELDADHDGKLAPQELAAGPRPGAGGMQGGMKGGMQGGTRPGPTGAGHGEMPTFADFDLNADGRVTEQEFNDARAERMKQRAQEGRMMRGMADGCAYAEIDTNSDGTVSPEEFAAHQAARRDTQMGQ